MQHIAEVYYNLIRNYVIYKFPAEIESDSVVIINFGFESGVFSEKSKGWRLVRQAMESTNGFGLPLKTYHFTTPDGATSAEYANKDTAYYNDMIVNMLKYMVANDYLEPTRHAYIAKDKILKNKKIDISI